MKYVAPLRIPIFRKAASALWSPRGDPSVYGLLEIDVTDHPKGQSPLPAIVRAIAETMRAHPELNSILRFGGIYHRSRIDISVMVTIPEDGRHDLSFATLTDVDRLSVAEIRTRIHGSAGAIRRRQDPHLGFALNLIRWLPAVLLKPFLGFYSFLVHDLHLDTSILRMPAHPFGAVIVTNVGSFGIKNALVPLVPLTRAPTMVSVGKISREPRVVGDEILIRDVLHLGVTFDHRLFDGSHAGTMIRDFEAHFARFSKELP